MDLGQRILEQVAPSLVVATVSRHGQPLRVPAVMVGPGVAAAYEILCRTGSWADLDDIPVRQGERSWRGAVCNERAAWQTCALDLAPEPGLPCVSPRWSATVSKGERLLAFALSPAPDAVATPNAAPFTVIEGVVEDLFPPDDPRQDFEPYERSFYVAATFRVEPSGGSLIFDSEGRLAGCVEHAPEPTGESIVIPGEWLTGYHSYHWMHALLDAARAVPDALHQALRLFEQRASLEDPRLFCAAHGAYGRAERPAAAAAALWRAAELDSDNPWIRERLEALAVERS
jgi:hypothetical protein